MARPILKKTDYDTLTDEQLLDELKAIDVHLRLIEIHRTQLYEAMSVMEKKQTKAFAKRDETLQEMRSRATACRVYTAYYDKDKDEISFLEKMHREFHGVVCQGPTETRSVTYYRFNNVLLCHYGGAYVIHTPQICTDEEWEDFKRGIISEKFFEKKASA